MSSKSTSGYNNSIPIPVGTLLYWGSSQVPPTFRVCDGASLLISNYPELYQVLGTSFGSADALHFNMPDFITYPFAVGGLVPAPNPANIVFPPTNLSSSTLPSLPSNHFALNAGWSLSPNVNGNNQYLQRQSQQAVGGTIKTVVKSNSSTVTTWSGTLSGTAGFANATQTPITPTLSSVSVAPPSLTLLPIMKVVNTFYPSNPPLPVATTSTFPIIPASQTYYPPNPDNIYLNDPQLSGFIF